MRWLVGVQVTLQLISAHLPCSCANTACMLTCRHLFSVAMIGQPLTSGSRVQGRDAHLERAIVQVLLGAPKAAVQLLKESPACRYCSTACLSYSHHCRPPGCF